MEKENKLKNKNVETYARDMVKAIESDKGGLIKKIIHEEEKHEAEKINLSPKSRKNRLFMFISIMLIFLALTVLVFLAFFNESVNVVPITPQATSIIFTDQTDFKAIDGFSKDQIVETILNQINNTKIKAGGVEGIYLTENKKVIGFKRFITLIKNNLILEQNIISDNFLLGALNRGLKPTSTTAGTARPAKGDFFMLLKVRSFSDIFPVMLGWENKMLYDLSEFFGININSNTNYLFTKDWQDGIVENKNARILKDNNGKIVLMYIFVNDSSVIVTSSEMATKEVILRIASNQIKK